MITASAAMPMVRLLELRCVAIKGERGGSEP
jgi:hypothetical protein